MITTYYKDIKDQDLITLDEFKPGAWIDVQEATQNDLHQIADLTKLTYFDLRDTLDPYEIPRIERQEEAILIYLRYPVEQAKAGLHTDVISIIITHEYLITISPNINQQLPNLKKFIQTASTLQRVRILMKLFLDVTNSFTSNIKTVRNNVLQQKREMKNIDAKHIVSLTENEEVLNQYLSSLIQTNSLFHTISNETFFSLLEEDDDILQDVSIGIKQSMDICKVDLHSINNLRDSYQIIFTNRLNNTMQLLTSITIILTVPTLIGSIYGMNVKLPLDHHPMAFWIIMLISTVFATILIIYFKKKGWL